MPDITTRKDGEGLYGPRYRVLVHGRPTPFTIEKSIPPKYRQPQLWDVVEGDDPHTGVLFDSHSLGGAVGVFQAIYDVFKDRLRESDDLRAHLHRNKEA